MLSWSRVLLSGRKGERSFLGTVKMALETGEDKISLIN